MSLMEVVNTLAFIIVVGCFVYVLFRHSINDWLHDLHDALRR